MDVRQLAALVAVADHGTFSAAAKALFTVQSNVSSHVARLEKELGATLVDRGRGELTDEGVRVVERARRILRDLDDLAADVATHDGELAGDVRVGMLTTTARWLLPSLLPRLRDQHPKVRVIVGEGSTSVLVTSLLSGQFNAAILHLPVDEPELQLEPLFAEDLVLVTAEGHPLDGRGSIHLAEAAQHELLLPPTGSALRQVLDRAAVNVGPPLTAAAEIDGVRLLATLAIDGFGAAIVPATAVLSPFDTSARVASIVDLPPRVVAVAWPRRPSPSATVRGVLAVVRDTIAQLADDQPGVHRGSDAFPLQRG